ncbi:hypothetical protein [Natrononativus amylolyticus]|nr:hypothetical protein [Natrononativus amylolyticus]
MAAVDHLDDGAVTRTDVHRYVNGDIRVDHIDLDDDLIALP